MSDEIKELKEKLEQSSCLLEEEQEKYKKARERAEKSQPILFTTAGSVISKEVSVALLDQAMSNFAKNPESVIPGYKEAATKYAKIKESEDFINNTDDDNVDTVLQMMQDGVDVKTLVDKVLPYVNALKNDSSLVD